MHFDWTITFGAVLLALSVVATVTIATIKLIAAISEWKAEVSARLDNHDEWISGHEVCNRRILKYMEDNGKQLAALTNDMAYLRGRAEERQQHGPQVRPLQDRY